MKLLVIGGGAREHAIAWKLSSSPQVTDIFTAPGNAGTAQLGTNLDISATDVQGLVDAVKRHGIDLTIVGPETSLSVGVVDRFRA